jgi:ribonuclease G
MSPDLSEEILINVTPRETRVAVVENGMLQEVHIERAWRRGYVGNIYKGRVQRVMPGMQAAFVEIGLQRAAFLHASTSCAPPAGGRGGRGPAAARRRRPPIAELVREGQEIVVQVVKDPIGSKGARLTTQLSIPSRYLVLLPHTRVLGVSARIEDEAERARLKALLQELSASRQLGYIVRTNAEGQAPRRWPRTSPTSGKPGRDPAGSAWQAKVGGCVYEDLSAAAARGARPDARRRREGAVDSRETWSGCSLRRQFMPELAERIEHYPASGRSSTCTASRTRSSARCRRRCR